MTPTTEPAKRIATLFKRRLSTAWSEREIRAYKKLVKQGCFTDPDDLRLVETYYVFNQKKEANYLRKDLLTFLNNFTGEVDRARTWAQHHKGKMNRANPKPSLIKLGPATDEDFEHARDIAKQEIERLRQQLHPV